MSVSAIELRAVSVRRGERTLVAAIDWSVRAGSVAAILGPNGCGKSTLARVISGYLYPTSGTVRVCGQTFGEVNLATLRESVRLIQPAGPFDIDPELSTRDVVLSGRLGTIRLFNKSTAADIARAAELLDAVGLKRVGETKYGQLSSGEKVRCLIARALLRPPAVLLLDEPTAGLDLLAREQVLAVVTRLHERSDPPPTVVMITHHIEELPPATENVLLLREGRVIASGLPRDVLTSAPLSAAYDCPVTVDEVAGRFALRVDPAEWSRLI